MLVTWWIPSSLIRSSLRWSRRTPGATACSSVTSSSDRAEQEGAGLLRHLARDHEPLDLLGALVDLRDLRVAHEALDGIFLDVAVAAEDLHGLRRALHRDVAALHLRHLARDHEPLDLLGALVDLRDLRVAHEALDGIFLDVAVAAEDLHGLRRALHPDGA